MNSLWVLQVMDYGFPQFTEAKILSEFIKTDAYKMEVSLPPCHLPACPSERLAMAASKAPMPMPQWSATLACRL